MNRFRVLIVVALACATTPAYPQSLPVGTLTHDGPATPEQLSLLLPVTGSLATSATASVRYRAAGASSWTQGHPLFRVRPGFSRTPAVGSVSDVFAWPQIGLNPGTTYDVEVTVESVGVSVSRTGTFTTRALPGPARAPNKSISPGASGASIQAALDGLVPGDVLEIANGTYSVEGLVINRSGTAGNPIVIRGASRSGTVLRDTTGTILEIRNANDVIIENLTLQGAGTDGGTSSWHIGILGGSNAGPTARNTIRRVTISGVDRGIIFYRGATEALVYETTVVGNNVWNSSYLGDNRTWDDDGINLPGLGNAAFNNTVSGFGDSFAYAQHVGSDTYTEARGVHFYRNEIRNSLDDLVEVDHGHRNITFYDNRSHNSANCSSLDPLYGGPFLYARNICINPARVNTHKWNDSNTGQFFYNNTIIAAPSIGTDADVSNWYQPNNGAQRAYGYRNNLHVYRGNGQSIWLESTAHDPIDWTHNSWFPDRTIQWDNRAYSNLAAAKTGLASTTPIFSGTTRRMENDNITVSNPWTATVTLGSNALTAVSTQFTPTLADGTSPRGSGAVIPNITDGYSGSAPDRGALITGRPIPSWGDIPATATPPPSPPSNLRVN